MLDSTSVLRLCGGSSDGRSYLVYLGTIGTRAEVLDS